MSLFLSLDPVEGVSSLALEQWNAALRKRGHRVEKGAMRRLGEPSEAPRDELAAWIGKHRPAAIFATLPLTFTTPEFFHRPEVAGVPTVLFWYDDPYRSLGRWGREPGYLDAMRLPSVHHFVWDGYWRRWMAETYGIASHPIHLAADPDDFHPVERPRGRIDAAVFVGTLLSEAHLDEQRASLPPVLAKAARHVEAAIGAGGDGENPFPILERVIAAFPARLRDEIAAEGERDPNSLLKLRGLTCKWGKNEVRRRMLRAALQVAPVAVFSGSLERNHAGKELEQLARGAPFPLVFRDTGGIPARDLGQLYAYGEVHLQATDPQSVEGGIPFRVFQTTASGKPLLTDVKPELLDCYREGSEIACYRGVAEIAPALRRLLDSAEERRALAEAGRARFLAQHTWNHRIAEVFGTLGISE